MPDIDPQIPFRELQVLPPKALYLSPELDQEMHSIGPVNESSLFSDLQLCRLIDNLCLGHKAKHRILSQSSLTQLNLFDRII